MRRYGLRDDQWDRIKDMLPGRDGHVGVTAKNNRLFVEAVLYRYRAGIPWRDLPERFGDPIKVHTRFSRWAKSGVWKRMFELLARDADNEYAMIDSTIVRAHARQLHPAQERDSESGGVRLWQAVDRASVIADGRHALAAKRAGGESAHARVGICRRSSWCCH